MRHRSFVLLSVFASVLPLSAQQVTTADYARAESMLSSAVNPLIDSRMDHVQWVDKDQVTFRETTNRETRLVTVEASTGKVLSREVYHPVRGKDETLSPDGRTTLFLRDWNLWAHNVKSDSDQQLTKDGVPNYGYATDNAGWQHGDDPVFLWAPDSRKIATFQQDQRKDGEMYLVNTQVGHPRLEAWKYPLPGDQDVTMIERVIVDTKTGKVVRLKFPADQHRSSLCDDVRCGDTGWDDVMWSPDSSKIAFLSTSRDHKQEHLYVADASTGDVRPVMSEVVKTYFESGNGKVNWQYLWKSDEVLWFSERDNWGQLYLYDGKTGKLKNQITYGDGNVTKVLRVDEATRTIYFLGVGKEKGRNPYYEHLYSVHFDGSDLKLLTPEDANHAVTLSPDGTYFVDQYSTEVDPPVMVLRRTDGSQIATLGKTNIQRLKAAGWVPLEVFTVKARDGKTDLYGEMFKPSHFDPSKKYPLVTYVYPGPQTGSVGSRSFMAARGDRQALAELGFIVIAVDGMGTPYRSKSFHDAYFERLEDNTLPDQVAAAKQLGARYPWIDLTRVGIWGHSGGGNASADAMFRYPDFYKVGIAESGNHDNRVYEDDWAEKWQGLLHGDNYEAQANQSMAKNLQGHLMLMHGTMDDNVPPNNTLLVVDALIKANKDFDLIMIPNAHHGYGAAAAYAMRRRWDYFVRYLAGDVPPKEYPVKSLTPPAH